MEAHVVDTTVNGKKVISFKHQREKYRYEKIQVPCGKCSGCKLDYSREWAIRCVHEASLHENNSFITLTYSPENLPEDHSVSKRELQLFFKKLRKKIGQFRYFACGEYGANRNRPHYHAIIFGYDFPDRTLWSKTHNGDLLFRSKELEKIWNKGFSTVGNVTLQSAQYVARYTFKKQKQGAHEHDDYELLDTETGEIHKLLPEFCLMSRRPGIGHDWYEKFKSDTDKDYLTVNRQQVKVPKYYDYLLQKKNEEELKQKKEDRKKAAKERKHDNTPTRLAAKETVNKAKVQLLKRGYEDG